MITGATGNVGTAVLRRLVAEPVVDSIVGVARRPGGPADPKVTWRAADVRDAGAMDDACRGADAVVHLAWAIQPSRDRTTTRSIDVDGSRTVFDAAARQGVTTLVHASSVGAYAPVEHDRPVDESHPATGIPSSFYSVDKAEVERRTGREALTELLAGMCDGAGGPTPALSGGAGGPLRLRELLSGLGARQS